MTDRVLGQTASPSDVANETVVAVAAAGFDGPLHLPTAPLDTVDFDALVGLAERHRVLGALAAVVGTGSMPVTDEQYELLAARQGRWLVHVLEVEQLLVRTDAVLADHGITYRVVKGSALCHLVYDDPGHRVYADLDIMVPSNQFDAARDSLVGHFGATTSVAELRPGFDREFGKEVLIRVGKLELDLHRTFVTGPFGLTVELDELYADRTTFEVGGRDYPALGPSALFMHACYNAALGDLPLRLSSLRDLATIDARSMTDFDTVVATAQRWKAHAVVQRAATLTCDVFDLDRSGMLGRLAALPVPRFQRWLLRSYLTPARSYSRPLASLAVVAGAGARVRYARALLSPSKEYLDSRGWTSGRHWRRAIRRLVPSRRGRG
ncbi:MAG: nucleotidyltransferase family protein [Acidimicrobiia bacterium]|nr:nucleotidyltransferase family protein [Acidimicrobiia bacterium]